MVGVAASVLADEMIVEGLRMRSKEKDEACVSLLRDDLKIQQLL